MNREDGCAVIRMDIAVGKANAALGMGMASRTIRDRLAQRVGFQAPWLLRRMAGSCLSPVGCSYSTVIARPSAPWGC